MNINCINNKIANSNTALKPIILQAILELFKDGNQMMTLKMVRQKCILLDVNFPKNSHNAAIGNAMRNSVECGGRIVREDRDVNDFTIAFDGSGNNFEITTPKKISLKVSAQTNIENSAIDKKINKILKSLDWEKLNDKKTPKLLIIGCCDAKSLIPDNLAKGEYVNCNFGDDIEKLRKSRLEFYKNLPDSYFTKKKRNREIADKAYFMNSLNENNRREALDVYGSNASPFYKPNMKKLYKDKINNSNLHLLIISGLYGIIKHSDYINDYHLKINRVGKGFWGNELSKATQEYIKINNIDNNDVFYSLSDEYLLNLNPILSQWRNIWIVGEDNAKTENLLHSAKCVSKLLNELP